MQITLTWDETANAQPLGVKMALNQVRMALENGRTDGKLCDVNGNTVGDWSSGPSPAAPDVKQPSVHR